MSTRKKLDTFFLRLINAVKDRPAIWDRSHHYDKAFLTDTWDELSEMFAVPSKYQMNARECGGDYNKTFPFYFQRRH